MENKNLLNHMFKKKWTSRIILTVRSLGLVILISAVVGATAAVLTGRLIKKIISKISTPKSSKESSSPPEFDETARSAELSESSVAP